MREHNKRWLVSRMQTSGSKRERVTNGRFADERHLQKLSDLEDLPSKEPIGSTAHVYNGKIHSDLLARFMNTQVGKDWDAVHSEIIARIPTKLLDYSKKIIYWYVAD